MVMIDVGDKAKALEILKGLKGTSLYAANEQANGDPTDELTFLDILIEQVEAQEADDGENSLVAVLSRTHEDGMDFAKAIRLTNFRVITNELQAQGLRIKTFVVTPGYVRRAHVEFFKIFPGFDLLLQDAVMSRIPPKLA